MYTEYFRGILVPAGNACIIKFNPSLNYFLIFLIFETALQNFPCQEVERHNKPEVEMKYVFHFLLKRKISYNIIHNCFLHFELACAVS
jgi:hypothetical protein